MHQSRVQVKCSAASAWPDCLVAGIACGAESEAKVQARLELHLQRQRDGVKSRRRCPITCCLSDGLHIQMLDFQSSNVQALVRDGEQLPRNTLLAEETKNRSGDARQTMIAPTGAGLTDKKMILIPNTITQNHWPSEMKLTRSLGPTNLTCFLVS